MTWSIVAREQDGAFGVAVATKFYAVGALCPHAAVATGAVATQAMVNPMLGPRALTLLGQGMAAADVLRILIQGDDGRDFRQLHMVDRAGRVAAHTGSGCVDWAGSLAGEGFSVAGNMLAGPQVLEATAAAFRAAAGRPLAERLLLAMEAGDAAGGDKRGRQSAALKVYTTEPYPYLDLRVDDHALPLPELRRIYEKGLTDFDPYRSLLPTVARPSGESDAAVIAAIRARRAAETAAKPG